MTLAVITQDIGTLTETFIRRHVQDLLPGKTVTIARGSRPGWTANGATIFTRHSPNILERAIRRISFGRIEPWKVEKLPSKERRRLTKFLRAHNVTVALGEYLDYGVRFVSLMKELNIPFFVHAHGYDVSKCLNDHLWRREYLKYNSCAGIIVPSRHVARRLTSIGIDSDRISVIPYGVTIPQKLSGVRGVATPVRMIAVGRLVGKKAPIATLQAFQECSKQFPKIELDLVGDGPLRPHAEAFVRTSGLTDVIRMHGAMEHCKVRQLMADADIFVQHSVVDPTNGDEELLPVAILEAMATGLPVVSTRHAGIPEAVEDGVTGFLVPEGDVLGMSARMLRLCRNPDLRQALGAAGRKVAEDRFSWERSQQSLLNLFGLK